jgi:hypothetical protein
MSQSLTSVMSQSLTFEDRRLARTPGGQGFGRRQAQGLGSRQLDTLEGLGARLMARCQVGDCFVCIMASVAPFLYACFFVTYDQLTKGTGWWQRSPSDRQDHIRVDLAAVF